jgi:hypothetical protein
LNRGFRGGGRNSYRAEKSLIEPSISSEPRHIHFEALVRAGRLTLEGFLPHVHHGASVKPRAAFCAGMCTKRNNVFIPLRRPLLHSHNRHSMQRYSLQSNRKAAVYPAIS